jgi:hypothetical protein
MKPLSSQLPLLAGSLLALTALRAPGQADAWSVAVLDRILAHTVPGQSVAPVGDMEIRVADLRAWRDRLAGGRAPKSAFAGLAPTWTDGNVFYSFDPSVSVAHQRAFRDAAGEWATFANLRLLARTTQANFVTIVENPALGGGGQATVGMTGGQQFLQLGPYAWNRGTICHELGHTLGLQHEHQRSDRDGFVAILSANILPGTEGNFIKLSNSQNRGSYDFLSVMHYARNQFSVNPAALDTIQPQPAYAGYLDVMGRDHGIVLSAADRAGMAAVYGAGPALTNVVSNTLDSGPGSLRAALYFAHDHPGTTITFSLPPTDPGFSNGVFTIQLTDQLPSLVHATVLDGASQPGNSNPDGPEVLLQGAFAPAESTFASGLRLTGTNCLIRAIAINRFAASCIAIEGTNATGNVVQGCYLGVTPSGTAAAGNGGALLTLSGGARGNTVGGVTAADRNVISGSTSYGLVIRDAGTRENSVQGNHLGLNANGTAALPNAWAGLAIFGGAQSNSIGGLSGGARNVISGNAAQGILLSGEGTTGNRVEGNYVGLNAAGTSALGNAFAGIEASGGAGGNTIGGVAAGAGNVISGNVSQGIWLRDANTSANWVQGNLIGTDPAGASAIGNRFAGIEILGGARGNTIGGTAHGSGNLISGNQSQGVFLNGTGTDCNVLQGNFIGLNLAGTSPVPNGFSGIELCCGARSNLLGGAAVGAGNVISGNANYGIRLGGSGTDGTVIQGNYIGVNAAGTAALPNAWTGVLIFDGARFSAIGGVVPGSGNVISGNGGQGVVIADAATSDNLIAGNFVGLSAAGTAGIANAWSGVELGGGARGNLVGGGPGARNFISGNGNHGVLLRDGDTALNRVEGNTIGLGAANSALPNSWAGVMLFGGAVSNQIGDTLPGTANLIASNLAGGVLLYDVATSNNTVRGNSITGNGGAGLAIYSGANRSVAAPTLTTASVGTNTSVSGSLGGLPGAVFQLDFYANPPPVAGAQARSYVGTWRVTNAPAGTIAFTASLPALVPAGYRLTATATDASGNTSGLSVGVNVTTVDSVGDGLPNAWRQWRFGGSGTSTNASSCAACDPDHDGLSNQQEFRAGTDPNQATSSLRLDPPVTSGSDLLVGFPARSGFTYRVEYRAALNSGAWRLLGDQLPGNGSVLQLHDPGVTATPERFYRLSVLP